MAIKWYKIAQFIKGYTSIYLPHSAPRLEEQRLLAQYYSPDQPKRGVKETMVVVCVDGHYVHGGLSDRLRGMASIFDYCQSHNIPFRIYHNSPFALEDYLLPHDYDWRIGADEISYHPEEATPVVINGSLHYHRRHRQYLHHTLQQHAGKQLHLYTHAFFADRHYAHHFNTLFTPAPRLAATVEEIIAGIGQPFVGATFRFQQLLGDFIEGDNPVLPENERKPLIDRCLDRLERLRSEEFPDRLILVTSDSSTFLRQAETRPWVRTIPGEVVHMDYTSDAAYEVYLKSFVDLFVLSRSEKVFLLRTGQMYPSGFPYRAAAQTGIPYRQIEF